MQVHPTRELTKEEADALQADMMEVLKKHNAEMSVTSSIVLLRYVEPNVYDEGEKDDTSESGREKIQPSDDSSQAGESA